MEEDKLIWNNAIELKAFESFVARKYDLQNSLPHNFLINKEGTVVAVDVSMKELESHLKSITRVIQ